MKSPTDRPKRHFKTPKNATSRIGGTGKRRLKKNLLNVLKG
nr:MAG TPA: hypothetical protein [Bacteriophage sp.]